jgi:hypothetical protein
VCEVGTPYEITVEAARELGFDVDTDYDLLQREVIGDVLVSGDDVSETKVHLLGQVDHVWRLDFTPPAGVAVDEAVPPGCPSRVVYELTVQLYAEDGSIEGTFAARTNATPRGSALSVNLYSESDLRNFRGSLPVVRDGSRPFFAMAEVQWNLGVGSEFGFYFRPRVVYQDSDGFCVEPFCPSASEPKLARISVGVASGSEMVPLVELVRSVADPSVTSLTEFVAAMGPYHPDVRLWVTASSAEPSSVQLRVRIDGKDVQTVPLELEYDPQILSAGDVGGWLDLGELDESVPVEFEVENAAGLSNVRSHIVIGGCVAAETTDYCAEPDCVARSAATIFPAACILN